MGCPPVRGDNLGALASGLSDVQVDKHDITIYTTYISVDLAHHEIFHAKGDIMANGIVSRTDLGRSQLLVTFILVENPGDRFPCDEAQYISFK